ncbi:hypothetical protein IB286_10790 [Spongiibacter sp. KMU-158]|uniref:histidine kinase n=1 Tax=Spongiibacter pelagi TaxID=2760804 RepID=A0A927C4A4_9GAMM|nr:ATP-binding protein [Spongiibacter pelagi]MBD2859491.1 hypothetical protein [Spongiibacter pelagi]
MNNKAPLTPHSTVLRIYAIFRLFLAFSLIMAFMLARDLALLGAQLPEVYSLVNSAYLAFAFIMLVRHLIQRGEKSENQTFIELFIDVGCLMLMSYCSSRDDSGLPMLLIVTVSAASVTLSARLALTIAALASISVISETLTNVLYNQTNPQNFVLAGSLGIAYFTTTVVIRYLNHRINKAQIQADLQASAVRKLSQINQQIVQRMQTGILVMNRSGTLRLYNDAAAELLNLPAKANPATLRAPKELTELINKGQRRSHILSIKNTQGELHVNWTRLTQQDGEEDYLLYLENLSKISQRAQNLKLASLGRFTASIAHEIRNPLAAISHAAQLLDENEDLGQLDRRFIAIIQNHVDRMNDIIKNILELSRGRPPEPEALSLQVWLQDFINDWLAHHNSDVEFSLNWDKDHEHPVNIDPSQLHQVLSNITENGIRHGNSDGQTAQIGFYISRQAISDATILDIMDNGPGIAPEDEDKIFEPFYTTQAQGNGLGLYLSRELCLANQIQISYRRGPEGESCFRLIFAHPDREYFSN